MENTGDTGYGDTGYGDTGDVGDVGDTGDIGLLIGDEMDSVRFVTLGALDALRVGGDLASATSIELQVLRAKITGFS